VLDAASIHGRFQPFHIEHLQYALGAKEECVFLWVGITKFDVAPDDERPLASHRERPENNPFTYFERITMIAEALVDAGVSRNSFGFIPFPIETPRRLPEFMPTSIPCFTTICEPWNHEKIKVLRACGYDVRVLWERQKTISSSTIRDDIAIGGRDWKKMVPPAVALRIERLNIRERLLRLRQLPDRNPEPD
jgi:nicotinamide-nucleotide adenylyltransferase